jgi:hypothetical protein
MGMDFSTQERLDDVDVFQLDDLVQKDFEVSARHRELTKPSWFGLIRYWISELRWRRKFWQQTRD